MINNGSPIIFIHDPRKLLVKNFLFNNTLTIENLNNFIFKWENNFNEGRFLRSTEVKTEDEIYSVKEMSENGLKKLISESKKSVVILFFDPNCRDCRKFYEVFEKASKLNNESMCFAKINVIKNDIDFIEIDTLPLVVISTSKDKLKFEIFQNEMNIDNFYKFVRKHSIKSEL